MTHTGSDYNTICFMDSYAEYAAASLPPHVLHILCKDGSMTFLYQDTRYLVIQHDLVILPEPMLASVFTFSDDFRGLIMVLNVDYASALAIRSNYGVMGRLTLLLNPVMKLADTDFCHCQDDMLHLRNRMNDERNDFWQEMIDHLLMAHILCLYNISARHSMYIDPSDRKAKLLVDFFTLLYRGDYIEHRSLSYYADKLCITPHYLTDICRQVTSRPATYWIDRFTSAEIARQLTDGNTALSHIATRMRFSSLSHFSRYTLAHLGLSPSNYRHNKGIK